MGAGLPAEQAVERRGLELEQACPDRVVDVESQRLRVDGLGEPRGGLAGRGGERDQRGRGARGERLLLEQRDDAGDGRRLAGARAAGHDREPSQHGRGGGLLLPRVGILALEQPGDAGGEDVHPHGGAGGAGERLEVGRDLLLLAPVAVEVERAADELQGAIGSHQPAGRDLARSSRTGSGHGSVARSIGSSTSTVAVSWIRSEVDEDVPDARRAHGQRGGQHHGLVRLADEAGEARRHVHVGRREHARVVELEQQPGCPAREADVEAVALVDRGHASRSDGRGGGRSGRAVSSVEHVAQRLDERGRRLPREHAARHAVDDRRVRPRHPAHEQVQHAGQVALGRVARQPPAQVAVQRDGVEQRLEPVVRVRHLGAERGRAVVPGGQVLARQREPVRLVVDDREAVAAEPQDEVDAAREVAAHVRAQPRVEQALRVARQRIARRRVRAQHVRDRGQRQRRAARVVAADQRQLEVELVEPVGARDVPQGDAARQRPQRRLDRRAQPGDHAREVAELDPPPRLCGRDLRDQLRRRDPAPRSPATRRRGGPASRPRPPPASRRAATAPRAARRRRRPRPAARAARTRRRRPAPPARSPPAPRRCRR